MQKAFGYCIYLLSILAVLSACSNNITVKKVGPASYHPLTPYDSVLVFNEEKQIKGSFEVIANIEFSNAGKYRRLELTDAIEPLKEAARGIGANGVIIDKSDSIWSGIVSRGISVEARAIRTALQASSGDQAKGEKSNQKERLKQLKEMLDEKVISKEEYDLKRKQILDSL